MVQNMVQKYGTCTIKYGTCTIAYGTCTIAYGTCTIVTMIAKYGTVTIICYHCYHCYHENFTVPVLCHRAVTPLVMSQGLHHTSPVVAMLMLRRLSLSTSRK